jgi:hypothetical protein
MIVKLRSRKRSLSACGGGANRHGPPAQTATTVPRDDRDPVGAGLYLRRLLRQVADEAQCLPVKTWRGARASRVIRGAWPRRGPHAFGGEEEVRTGERRHELLLLRKVANDLAARRLPTPCRAAVSAKSRR